MKTILIKILFIFAVLLLGGMTKAIADAKLYPASMCVRWDERGGNSLGAIDPPSYSNYGRRFNPSAILSLRLDCPVVRDNFTSLLNISTVNSSWIRVIDRSAIDKVCAAFVAVRHSGVSFFTRNTAFQCTTVASNTPDAQTLFTGALSNASTVVPTDSHYYFSVQSVPRNAGTGESGIVSYYVNEYDIAQ